MKNKIINILIEDYKLNSLISFFTILIYRTENMIWSSRYSFIIYPFSKFTSIFKRILGIQSQISYKCTIGTGLRLPHKAFGVIISPYATIGDDVTIFHLVTIGVNESKAETDRQITIGDGSYLSVGCKIISCTLGKKVKVAPNVVVYYDCEDGVLVK